MVVEVMGRFGGWIALYSGVAGGADVILLPEIPFRFEPIVRKIDDRWKSHRHFAIVVAAEGARPVGGEFFYKTQEEGHEPRLGGIAEFVAEELAPSHPLRDALPRARTPAARRNADNYRIDCSRRALAQPPSVPSSTANATAWSPIAHANRDGSARTRTQ